MPDLHTRISAELDRREQTVYATMADHCGSEESNNPEWTYKPDGSTVDDAEGGTVVPTIERDVDGEHIALHDPADALRRYTADRELLAIADRFEQSADELKRNGINPWKFEIAARDIRQQVADSLGIDTTPDTREADRADPTR